MSSFFDLFCSCRNNQKTHRPTNGNINKIEAEKYLGPRASQSSYNNIRRSSLQPIVGGEDRPVNFWLYGFNPI